MMRMRDIFVPVVAGLVILMAIGCGKNPTKSDGDYVISFSKDAIAFGAGHLQDVVVLTNENKESIEWDVTATPNWITVDKSSGRLRASSTDSILVFVSTDGLAMGSYEGTIHIEWDGGEDDISIQLTHQAGSLDVNLLIFNFDRNAAVDELVLINRGTESITWTIPEKPEWIEVGSDSGMVFGVPDTVLLRVNYSGMAYGEYTGSLRVVSTAGDVTITIHFIMEQLREVYPGYAVGNIRVGSGTYQKILDTYGQCDWKSYDDDAFVHSIGYTWLGLQFDFYTEQGDLVLYETTQCTGIVMKSPYDGLTPDEIGIGSTQSEVVAVYGEPQQIENGEEVYDTGIAFTYESDVVKAMRIFEP